MCCLYFMKKSSSEDIRLEFIWRVPNILVALKFRVCSFDIRKNAKWYSDEPPFTASAVFLLFWFWKDLELTHFLESFIQTEKHWSKFKW